MKTDPLSSVLFIIFGEVKVACRLSEFHTEYYFILTVEIASGRGNANRD
jgi:hypothetical protein